MIADTSYSGPQFGAALAAAIDQSWPSSLAHATGIALVATGSYGRSELCPGSDVDAWLIGAKSVDPTMANECWYPIWDANIPLGHAVRTLKEVSRAAEDDLETLTAGLDLRHVIGDRAVTEAALERVRAVAARRADTLIRELRDQVHRRDVAAIAEMLEPDLKDGGGGLRDIDALRWLDTIQRARGKGSLIEGGYLSDDDDTVLILARQTLLAARVALHRVTASKGNLLPLQEQDAVGELLGRSADELLRGIADAARRVSWVARDVFDRMMAKPTTPKADIRISPDVVIRDGAVAIVSSDISDECILEAAAVAAERGIAFERTTMNRLAVLDARCAVWTPNVRALFERLLNAGPPTVDVVEALDHVGVFTRFVPEWDHVRSLPQRNAYHRFTVDRHLLETVAEAATFARAEAERGNPCSERELTLLLLGALMHDLAKGRPQDHSVLGAELARELAFRMGYHDADANTLSFLVRHHLLLADTAVRRDLNDPSTIQQVGAIVGDRHRLRVLLLLTLADTKATGPAAWSQSKATLMRTLAQRVEAWLVDGRIPDGGARREMLAEHATLLAGGAPHVEWRSHEDGLWECIVVAPDQRGLLAACGGALASIGFDIRNAGGYSADHGMALEVFVGHDRFDRLSTSEGKRVGQQRIIDAIGGTFDYESAITDHVERYHKGQSDVVVTIDQDASQVATVVEVSADDVPGLLAVVAGVFADFELDVDVAKVATFGHRVVDVFYVRGPHGKIHDRYALERLRATLIARLTSRYGLRH